MVSSSFPQLNSYQHTLFLGHFGVHVAEYTELHLPHLIHAALRSTVGQCKSGRLNPESISKLLNSQIRNFDREIGKAVVNLCPKPEDIDDGLAPSSLRGTTWRRPHCVERCPALHLQEHSLMGRNRICGSLVLGIHRQVGKLSRRPFYAKSCQFYLAHYQPVPAKRTILCAFRLDLQDRITGNKDLDSSL
jgi:hypothetical protein